MVVVPSTRRMKVSKKMATLLLLTTAVLLLTYCQMSRQAKFTPPLTKHNSNMATANPNNRTRGMSQIEHARVHDNSTQKQCIQTPVVCVRSGLGRLGNQLFRLASSLGIAISLNMTARIPEKLIQSLSEVFERPSHPRLAVGDCPTGTPFLEEKTETDTNEAAFLNHAREDFGMEGYFISWRYFHHIEVLAGTIRELFRVPGEAEARACLARLRRQHGMDAVYVGIHVRRGDYLRKEHAQIAKVSYYANAMQHFMSGTYGKNVHFLVCSDEPDWCRQELGRFENVTVHSGSIHQDLSLLVSCDQLILTCGTFGFWAAYLNGHGDVVYFNRPWVGSFAYRNEQMKTRFYLPHWLALGD